MSGIFDDDDDDEGIFETDNNPLLSSEQVQAASSPPVSDVRGDYQPTSLAPAQQKQAEKVRKKASLIAVYDQNSQPLVAKAILKGGKPHYLEGFRRPTADEFNSLAWGGKIVKGGVVVQNEPTDTGRGLEKSPLGGVTIDWKKLGLWVGGATVVGVGGFFTWRHFKKKKLSKGK